MHRITSLYEVDNFDDSAVIEQPQAPVLLLTSAATDIATLAEAIDNSKQDFWKKGIRALPLSALSHPAQIDHYLATTAAKSKIIGLIRFPPSIANFNGSQNSDSEYNSNSTSSAVSIFLIYLL